MADPTQALRDKIGDTVLGLMPDSSPLKKSLKDEELKQKVAQAAPVETAPVEARKPAQTEAAPQTEFVSQDKPSTPIANKIAQGPAPAFDFGLQMPADLKGGLNEQRQAYQQEVDIYKQSAADIAKAEAQFNAQVEEEEKAKQQAIDLETQVAADVDERSRMRLEPKNFFAGKSTWQKIMGGLGLVLSSYSKEGAQRFAEAVDKDIELDLKAQESAIMSKDKAIAEKQSLVKQYFDKYKDLRAARYLAKADVLNSIRLRTEAMLGSTKSQAAAGAARQTIGMLDLEIQKYKQAGTLELLKKGAQSSEGLVPGFEGYVADKTEARQMRTAVAQQRTALSAIAELEKITNTSGKSFNPEMRARANQLTQDLQLGLKEIKALGVLSGDDAKRLDDYISSPAQFFKLDATSLAQLKGLKSLINNAVLTKAATLGLKPVTIGEK